MAVVHVAGFGLAGFELTKGRSLDLQEEFLDLSALVIVQYWVLALMVRNFIDKHGRPPRLTTYSVKLGTSGEERILSGVAFAIGIGSAILFGYLAKHA